MLAVGHETRATRDSLAAVASQARAVGLDRVAPRVMSLVERESDPYVAMAIAGRALLAAELDPSWHNGLAPELRRREAAAAPARLAAVQDFARRLSAARPASAVASLLAGGAAFAARRYGSDTRLYREAASWEVPLRRAIELAPRDPEPTYVLAAAEIQIWFALSASQRLAAQELVARAFAEPSSFDRLLDDWLAVRGHAADALAVIPATSAAWRRVRGQFAALGDWDGYVLADRRAATLLEEELRRDLALAEEMLAAGDHRRARGLFLSVAARLEPGVERGELLIRIFRQVPPGPVSPELAAHFVRWLRFSADLCLIGRCPLPADVVARLDGSARDAPALLHALAALAADDLPRAESFERRAEANWSEPWGPFVIGKTRLLLAHGDLAAARTTFAELHRDWLTSPPALVARHDLALALEDPAAVAASGLALTAGAAEAWPATAWRFREGLPHQLLLSRRNAAGLTLELAVPASGAVLEVAIDGAAAPLVVVRGRRVPAGATPSPTVDVTVGQSIPAGLHLVALRWVAGAAAEPRGLRLRG